MEVYTFWLVHLLSPTNHKLLYYRTRTSYLSKTDIVDMEKQAKGHLVCNVSNLGTTTASEFGWDEVRDGS